MNVYERERKRDTQKALGSVVSERGRCRRGEEWSAAGSHIPFLKSDWLGFSLKGLLCIL